MPSTSRREICNRPKVVVEGPEADQSAEEILGINVGRVVNGHLAFASFEGVGEKFRGIIVPERNTKIMVNARQLAAA